MSHSYVKQFVMKRQYVQLINTHVIPDCSDFSCHPQSTKCSAVILNQPSVMSEGTSENLHNDMQTKCLMDLTPTAVGQGFM